MNVIYDRVRICKEFKLIKIVFNIFFKLTEPIKKFNVREFICLISNSTDVQRLNTLIYWLLCIPAYNDE